MKPTVLAGRATADFAEGFVEPVNRSKSGIESHMDDLSFRGDEQTLGVGNSVLG
jgi:hypothetical protein